MNNTFVLLDKNNNLQKNANMVVKFNFENKDYLVYGVEENEQNCQIFVSKLVLNSEGKYFIDNILSDEKNKLSNIVYNIVILLPTDMTKGNDFQSLINNLFNKFSVKLLSGLPTLDTQEYFSNCSIAITNKTLVENAIKLYDEKLNVVKNETVIDVPTWTAPLEVTAPTPVDDNSINVQEPSIDVISIPVQEPINDQEVEVEAISSVGPIIDNSAEVKEDLVHSSEPVIPVTTNNNEEIELPNPQAEKLAIVSDPSLGIGVHQPNVMQNKKAGFANTKYVVIGTICLVLAIAVVITAYILIKNIK